MGQIFSEKSNAKSKFLILFLFVVLGGSLVAATGAVQSPYLNGAGESVDQPIQFSHEHHVQGLGLDCRFCHSSVENSSHANYPDTATCMTCHSQIWKQARILEPVRNSFKTGQPLRWTQVYQLPDHVYFDHSVHVNNGIACVTCHGAVSRMPVIVQARTFMMKDCMECHRHPENYIRPRTEIFNEDWVSRDQSSEGAGLLQEYHVRPIPLTNCSVCHR